MAILVRTRLEGQLDLVMNTDEIEYGGHSHIDPHNLVANDGHVKVYIPARTALVYGKA